MVFRPTLIAIAVLFSMGQAAFMGRAACAGEMVVIASTLSGLAPGQIIDGARALEIPEGGEVTLISQSGAAVRLTGPFAGAPETRMPAGAPAPDLIEAVALLASGGGVDDSDLGMARGLAGVVPADPWVIDVSRGGDHCVRPEGARLWRENGGAGQSLTLRHVALDRKAKMDWPGDRDTLAWPGDVPFEDAAVYLVRFGASPLPVKLVLHFVPAGQPSEAHRAVWMAGEGCRVQARALLNTLR